MRYNVRHFVIRCHLICDRTPATISKMKRRVEKIHEPTEASRAEVQALAAFDVPHLEIAAYIGIGVGALRAAYADELRQSKLTVHARVANFLASAATGAVLQQNIGASYKDCLSAAIFYGKTRMGMSETNRLLIAPDTPPLTLDQFYANTKPSSA